MAYTYMASLVGRHENRYAGGWLATKKRILRKRGKNMENEEVKVIPWIAHEAEMTRFERAYRRVWILCIIIFVALVLTNAGWIWYESQFEDTVVSQDVDTGFGSAVVSGIGDIYGTDTADNQNTTQKDGR